MRKGGPCWDLYIETTVLHSRLNQHNETNLYSVTVGVHLMITAFNFLSKLALQLAAFTEIQLPAGGMRSAGLQS